MSSDAAYKRLLLGRRGGLRLSLRGRRVARRRGSRMRLHVLLHDQRREGVTPRVGLGTGTGHSHDVSVSIGGPSFRLPLLPQP